MVSLLPCLSLKRESTFSAARTSIQVFNLYVRWAASLSPLYVRLSALGSFDDRPPLVGLAGLGAINSNSRCANAFCTASPSFGSTLARRSASVIISFLNFSRRLAITSTSDAYTSDSSASF